MCKYIFKKKNYSIKLTKKILYIYIYWKSGGSFEPPENSVEPPMLLFYFQTISRREREIEPGLIIAVARSPLQPPSRSSRPPLDVVTTTLWVRSSPLNLVAVALWVRSSPLDLVAATHWYAFSLFPFDQPSLDRTLHVTDLVSSLSHLTFSL